MSENQFKKRLISQLINSISRVSTFFVLPVTGDFAVVLIFNLNDSDCIMLSFGSSL